MNELTHKGNLRKACFAVCFLSLCMVGLTINDLNAETRGVSETGIRIGCIPDLTGPSARGCRGHLWGITNYLDEINARGGIHGGK
ncbi:MAG: hypothetical protein JRG75_09240 [Deltaproteobacteria bacterium]|nr:hypothetical protein [Deltaproteobacteria bacterium]